MPGARCTRGLVCQKCAFRRTRAYRAAETLRHPLRNGFTAYIALSPVERACCHRHFTENFPQSLAPASRRQDHTTSPYASAFSSGVKKRLTPKRPPHSDPTHRDDRETPLLWAGMGEASAIDLPDVESEIFLILFGSWA